MPGKKPAKKSTAKKSTAKKPSPRKARAKETRAKEFLLHHKDGTLWAKGQQIDGVPIGYWEWFRKDGTKLRSGHFIDGEQVGEWTTYDGRGKVHKVTVIKPKREKS
jgi:antitoxin component YwqK of YwqJK toxin-antitoxin module